MPSTSTRTKNSPAKCPCPWSGGSTGITYTPQTGSDLKTWTTTGVTLSAPDANNYRTASIPLSGGRHFLRLGVAY